jgi:hypothetical protein
MAGQRVGSGASGLSLPSPAVIVPRVAPAVRIDSDRIRPEQLSATFCQPPFMAGAVIPVSDERRTCSIKI